MQGQCTCGEIRYRLTARPLFVHACHCRWCQRETGSAFVMNALVETACVERLAGQTVEVLTPSESGKGQRIHRCPSCHVALWSHYPGAGPKFAFVRVGTLEDPDTCPPDVHIFTDSKQAWVILPPDVPNFAQFYDIEKLWPAAALARRARARGQV
ncbi:GFA family protein [Seohaeicola zhoushanensis]|uniref:Aldehyde-activating protein n=1 Tax=Seohaeicola zhoushanensis TaxID=1569283 RepID=A0A8J3H1W8_9RHOB|nr:GFA family protein [Seohaeicola zhoushanensis]GHF66708.1 aldehyde-activating protein [Seohaeicola zhoushanensis]